MRLCRSVIVTIFALAGCKSNAVPDLAARETYGPYLGGQVYQDVNYFGHEGFCATGKPYTIFEKDGVHTCDGLGRCKVSEMPIFRPTPDRRGTWLATVEIDGVTLYDRIVSGNKFQASYDFYGNTNEAGFKSLFHTTSRDSELRSSVYSSSNKISCKLVESKDEDAERRKGDACIPKAIAASSKSEVKLTDVRSDPAFYNGGQWLFSVSAIGPEIDPATQKPKGVLYRCYVRDDGEVISIERVQ